MNGQSRAQRVAELVEHWSNQAAVGSPDKPLVDKGPNERDRLIDEIRQMGYEIDADEFELHATAPDGIEFGIRERAVTQPRTEEGEGGLVAVYDLVVDVGDGRVCLTENDPIHRLNDAILVLKKLIKDK
jgi:hypothetical protein